MKCIYLKESGKYLVLIMLYSLEHERLVCSLDTGSVIKHFPSISFVKSKTSPIHSECKKNTGAFSRVKYLSDYLSLRG